MKKRLGFVSNSSSSSFVISTQYLSPRQIQQIHNHIEEARKLKEIQGCTDYGDSWTISEGDGYIEGYVFLDNFDMDKFLEVIGVDMSKVKWTD